MPSRCFTVLSDRTSPWEVDKIAWNPSLDALALASFRGEIILQRLFWKKAWKSALPSDLESSEAKISALTWSPDGKHLAAAHAGQKGQVRILELETGRQIHQLIMEHAISYLSWTDLKSSTGDSNIVDSSEFKPWLPNLHKDSKSHSDDHGAVASLLSSAGTHRNFLCVGCQNGTVILIANGFLPLLTLNSGHSETMGVVQSIYIDMDLRRIAVCTLQESDKKPVHGQLALFDTSPLISGRKNRDLWRSIDCLAEVWKCVDYLDFSVSSLVDGWEDLLLEIDEKFSSYAKQKFLLDGGSVGDDLMVLLVFGSASPEFQVFLQSSLTEKGIKQVSQFIERCFKKTYEVVSQNLSSVSAALVFYLSNLKNEAPDDFISEDEPLWKGALSAAGTLSLKISEIQGVISKSQKELRIFFTWLNQVVSELTDRTKPSGQSLCAEDLDFVVQFIQNNFMQTWSEEGDGKTIFKLERIGQYFKKGPISIPVDLSANPWIKFEQKCVAEGKSRLFLRNPELSLIDCAENLHGALKAAEDRFRDMNCMNARLLKQDTHKDVAKMCISGDFKKEFLLRLFCSSGSGKIVTVTDIDKNSGDMLKTCKIDFGSLNLNLVDFAAYKNSSFICLVKGEPRVSQNLEERDSDCGILRLTQENCQNGSLELLGGPNLGWLERRVSCRVFVSANRGLGCVLAECNRRVTLLDLEPGEETTVASSLLNLSSMSVN